jgi:hypothetical protein
MLRTSASRLGKAAIRAVLPSTRLLPVVAVRTMAAQRGKISFIVYAEKILTDL